MWDSKVHYVEGEGKVGSEHLVLILERSGTSNWHLSIYEKPFRKSFFESHSDNEFIWKTSREIQLGKHQCQKHC